MTYSLSVTGHRPEEFSPEQATKTREFLTYAFERHGPSIDHVTVGMARGVDLWAGSAALDAGLAVVAAVPYTGHRDHRTHGPRTDEEVAAYDRIIAEAVRTHVVAEFAPLPEPKWYELTKALQARNVWMVDTTDRLLAVWNGKPKGGTYNCWAYNEKKAHHPVLHYNPSTNQIFWNTPTGWAQAVFSPVG